DRAGEQRSRGTLQQIHARGFDDGGRRGSRRLGDGRKNRGQPGTLSASSGTSNARDHMDSCPPPPHTSLPRRLIIEPDLLVYLNVLYRYRHLAVSVFLLVVLVGLLRTYTTIPLYRASARLMIEADVEPNLAMTVPFDTGSAYYWQDPKVYYETQYRILTGTELARRVVTSLKARRLAEFVGADATSSDSTLIAQVLARVSIHPVPNSPLVDVAFVSADAAFAALAANTLTDQYVQQNLELRGRAVSSSLEWLSRELVNQQQKVQASERAMTQYREEHNALSLEEPQNIVVARL